MPVLTVASASSHQIAYRRPACTIRTGVSGSSGSMTRRTRTGRVASTPRITVSAGVQSQVAARQPANASRASRRMTPNAVWPAMNETTASRSTPSSCRIMGVRARRHSVRVGRGTGLHGSRGRVFVFAALGPPVGRTEGGRSGFTSWNVSVRSSGPACGRSASRRRSSSLTALTWPPCRGGGG